MSRIIRLTFGVIAVLCPLVISGSARAGYIIQDLGILAGGNYSGGIAVNSQGTVAGYESTNNGGYFRATIYAGGKQAALGSIGGLYSHASAINASGDIVGEASPDPGNPFIHKAFFYDHTTGQLSVIPTLGGSDNSASGINDSGLIVGTSGTADGSSHAFSYFNNQLTDLGAMVHGGVSWASAVNASGDIAGAASTVADKPLNSDNPQHAVFYSQGVFHDLGTLGGLISDATGINNSGVVIGESYVLPNDFSLLHAFAYANGKMTDLGTLGGNYSSASSINNQGQIIGNSSTAGGDIHPFLYQNGKIVDLNSLIDPSSGWTLVNVGGINDAGQITGYGVNPDGKGRAFLLTPTAAAVPEPSSLLMAGIGGFSLAILLRRRG